MSRDQRVNDNWALLYAKELAQKHDLHLAVAFCPVPQFLGATGRQYRFLLQGLKEVEKNLKALNIPFYLLQGDPGKEMARLLSEMVCLSRTGVGRLQLPSQSAPFSL